jgi:transcriptional regulator with GAF, ATPase, and Fis domain
MTIALFGAATVRLAEISAALQQEGLSVVVVPMGQKPSVPTALDRAILVCPQGGILTIGEEIRRVRSALPQTIQLLLCTFQITAEDRSLLQQCGANGIVSPQGWDSKHAAERILGELILAGEVKPITHGELLGATRPMQRLYENMQMLATLNNSILISGETGTGKELVAKELHNFSGRQRYLPANFAAISNGTFESELFGHKRGAFTGAVTDRDGLLLASGDGTVFLDEIGELDMSIQVKLLRAIEYKLIKRMGEDFERKVQARILMATNRDLDQACKEGTFRPDLYWRIKSITLTLPPLRERKADIPLLVHHFVAAFNKENNRHLQIPDGALDCLFEYDWPGNVRELKNVIEDAAAFARNSVSISSIRLQEYINQRIAITTERVDAPNNAISFDPLKDTWEEVYKRIQKKYVQSLLKATKGNKSKAATLAGMTRPHFSKLCSQLGLNTEV